MSAHFRIRLYHPRPHRRSWTTRVLRPVSNHLFLARNRSWEASSAHRRPFLKVSPVWVACRWPYRRLPDPVRFVFSSSPHALSVATSPYYTPLCVLYCHLRLSGVGSRSGFLTHLGFGRSGWTVCLLTFATLCSNSCVFLPPLPPHLSLVFVLNNGLTSMRAEICTYV